MLVDSKNPLVHPRAGVQAAHDKLSWRFASVVLQEQCRRRLAVVAAHCAYRSRLVVQLPQCQRTEPLALRGRLQRLLHLSTVGKRFRQEHEAPRQKVPRCRVPGPSDPHPAGRQHQDSFRLVPKSHQRNGPLLVQLRNPLPRVTRTEDRLGRRYRSEARVPRSLQQHPPGLGPLAGPRAEKVVVGEKRRVSYCVRNRQRPSQPRLQLQHPQGVWPKGRRRPVGGRAGAPPRACARRRAHLDEGAHLTDGPQHPPTAVCRAGPVGSESLCLHRRALLQLVLHFRLEPHVAVGAGHVEGLPLRRESLAATGAAGVELLAQIRELALELGLRLQLGSVERLCLTEALSGEPLRGSGVALRLEKRRLNEVELCGGVEAGGRRAREQREGGLQRGLGGGGPAAEEVETGGIGADGGEVGLL